MPLSISCPECTNEIPQPAERCPHCGEPGYFWNVIEANEPSESAALDRRYQTAKAKAVSRGADVRLQNFENAIARCQAVIVRPEHDVLRLATSTRQLYGTYYQQIEAELRLPDGDKWDAFREIADTVLFPHYKKDIRFGALSLDGIGVLNYGSCSITLRDEMISHRASVFEENSARFVERQGTKIPKGYRAAWNDRSRLCVAKLSGEIDSATGSDKYSGLLLRQGTSSDDDEFVEVHIWGPMTVLTMEKVIITAPGSHQQTTIRKAIEFKLTKHNVKVS
jgi:hypothetical protein